MGKMGTESHRRHDGVAVPVPMEFKHVQAREARGDVLQKLSLRARLVDFVLQLQRPKPWRSTSAEYSQEGGRARPGEVPPELPRRIAHVVLDLDADVRPRTQHEPAECGWEMRVDLVVLVRMRDLEVLEVGPWVRGTEATRPYRPCIDVLGLVQL